MKRPILIACVGYIIGIIWGLYLKISIIPFNIFLYFIIYFLLKRWKKIRYFKILLKWNFLLIFFMTSILSNLQILQWEKEYQTTYQQTLKMMTGIVESNPEEKEYFKTCIIKEIETNKKYILRFSKEIPLVYGDFVQIKGEYEKPSIRRNYGGFDYSAYLKTKKIYGTMVGEKIDILQREQGKLILRTVNKLKISMMGKAEKLLEKDKDLLMGILIGETSELEEEIQENFRKSSLSHILAVSGMHVQYIILGMTFLLEKVAIGKRKIYILIIIILILFMLLVGFTSSVVRACIMGIILMGAKIVYRKSDIQTSIAISLLCILMNNPYAIYDFGLILSYGGTIGIILFTKPISILLKKKIPFPKLCNMTSVILSAQIVLFPILLYCFNTLSLTFLIANLFVSTLIEIITILGFVCIFSSYIIYPLASFLAIILKLLLSLLNLISEFVSQLPFSEIILPTPAFINVILYFLLLGIIKYSIDLKSNKNLYRFQKKQCQWLCLNKKKILIIYLITMLIFKHISIFPLTLKVYFIDVGQRR